VALRAEGASSFAAETYGHPEHRDAIAGAGLELPLLPVDSGGAVVDELGDADAALLTPAHQFPLGVALVAERRRRAVEWARDSGGVIVEDDYDGEFRYDRQPVGAMQALGPDTVIYAGTASKSLAPGLRIAWLVVPSRLVAAVVSARQMIGPSALEQLTLAELIRSGAYDRHVRRARLAYRRRRDHLVTALGRSVPSVSLGGIAAGLQAVVELPDGWSEDEIVDRARGHGLALEGLGAYAAAATHAPALVVGYAKPPEHAFSGAVARLCAVLAT
jgi:GntR family transcriptional regulator/MocR family aminotransferase